VIVSDVGGLLPWYQTHIPSIIDARERLLAPGGMLIPQRDAVWASVVQAPELYERFTGVWDNGRFGFDMEAARRIVINTWRKARLTPEHLLVEPKCWATLDYATVASPAVRANISWTVARKGTAHGLGVWFDRTVGEGVNVCGAPGVPEKESPVIYGHVFFPWFKPVALAPGETVSVSIKADLVGEDYIWSWKLRVLDGNAPRQIKADFKQCSFFGEPLSPVRLRKQAASYVPALTDNGQIDRYILESMDGRSSSDEIARSLSARYPSRFAKWSEALTRVGELAKKYSR
jgi:protein arginine N-methyltransferase 1